MFSTLEKDFICLLAVSYILDDLILDFILCVDISEFLVYEPFKAEKLSLLTDEHTNLGSNIFFLLWDLLLLTLIYLELRLVLEFTFEMDFFWGVF